MARVAFTIIRGDDRTINLDLTEGNTQEDITGATVFFTAKPALTDDVTDTTAVISKTVTDIQPDEDGTYTIPLASSDTNKTPGIYHYDIQIKDTDGTIVSLPEGLLEIKADVTRRTT